MKAEIQNQLWAILPKEARVEVKVAYGIDTIDKHFDNSYNTALIDIFGLHNLTSDTKPEEMLMVERKYIQEMYADGVGIHYLSNLFGDKCLPDKEEPIQVEPKFHKGDKVVIIKDCIYKGRICTINEVEWCSGIQSYNYRFKTDEVLGTWCEDFLEPYTEEKEPMEEKELNLCELLAYQDLSGTYSPIYGEVRVTDIACDRLVITPEHSSDNNVELFPDGRFSKNGDCLLFPSRALYEKYPLDAYSAWMEWKAERKPKHTLQAQIRLISNDGKTIEDYECVEVEVPNIDLTQAAEAVRETLMKIHEKKLK